MAEVTMVPVREILRHVEASLDFDPWEWERDGFWATVIRRKVIDLQMPALLDAIQAEGFTAPIGIVRPPRGPWLQHNGHHRIVAAILLCMDEVPVVFIDREVEWEDDFLDDDDGIFDATGGYDWDDFGHDYGQSALDDAEWLYQQVTIR